MNKNAVNTAALTAVASTVSHGIMDAATDETWDSLCDLAGERTRDVTTHAVWNVVANVAGLTRNPMFEATKIAVRGINP